MGFPNSEDRVIDTGANPPLAMPWKPVAGPWQRPWAGGRTTIRIITLLANGRGRGVNNRGRMDRAIQTAVSAVNWHILCDQQG